MSRPSFLRALPCVVLLAGFGCADPPPLPSAPGARASATTDAGLLPSAPTLPSVPEPFLDLLAAADRAHVRREGPVLAPTAPGWGRVSQLADRGPWLAPKVAGDQTVSWLEGIGGTLFFPVGAGGPSLRTVEIALRPIARGQVVSVFVDEEPVTTMRLEAGASTYALALPMDGLAPGEHSLRFWFRFTRYQGKRRVPAAFASARFFGADEPAPLPETWIGPLEVGGVRAEALLAGPPTGWSYYLLPPSGGRLFARAAVASGGPVDFVVRVAADGEEVAELRRVSVQPGTSTEIDVDLSAYRGRPVRLDLDTEGAAGPIGAAGWIEPAILMPGRLRGEVPPVRNVIVWMVDGLRSDRIGLGRGGDRAATPNLDLLAGEGVAAVDVWSGGASAADGHARLLRPAPDGPSLPEAMAGGGRRTGFLSSSSAVSEALSAPFQTRLDLVRSGEAAETRVVLRELDTWLDVRKRQPFFLYIATADPRVPLSPAEGYQRLYERSRPPRGADDADPAHEKRRELLIAYDAELSAADYWIGQLVALLQRHGVADDTAIIVAGSVGQELRENGGLGDGHALVPEIFQVPIVVWHPGRRNGGTPRPVARGGDLADLASTVVVLAGGRPPPEWPGIDLVPALFHGLPLPPQPSHARLGNQVAARFGGWLLRGAGNREMRLWNLRDDPAAREDVSARSPIALRTLRDSMLDRP